MRDFFNIGVFYAHRSFADEYIKKLLDELDESDIISVRKNEIQLRGGVRYLFMPTNDYCRGQRLDRAYVEGSVNEDYINYVIKPLLSKMQLLIL